MNKAINARTTRDIAEFVCDTTYKDLGSEVIEYSKILALSHLGTNIAGSTMDFGRIVNKYVKDKGAYAEVGVYGSGFRTSVDYGAMANGNSANATELKDKSPGESMYAVGHWPTVFAMGEKLKRSGGEVIEAFVIGYEVASKLGIAFQDAQTRGYSPSVCCTIGNAVSVAKLLGLNADQTISAISLAASQVAGIGRQNGSGAHVIEPGWAARNGICAAELAALGYTGQPDILEGKRGFGDLSSNCPEFNVSLGGDYIVMRVTIRKYSCVGMAKRYIEGVLGLMREHNITWEDVNHVEHAIDYKSAQTLKYDQPATAEEARFSLPHITVACFFDERVFLPSFTDERARDPHWREAREKVKVTIFPDRSDCTRDSENVVTITMKDGICHRAVCRDALRGSSDIRVSENDAMNKYLGCMEFAGKFSRARADQIAEMTLGLDKVEDISSLAALLTFPNQS